jgi:hypothetical protein
LVKVSPFVEPYWKMSIAHHFVEHNKNDASLVRRKEEKEGGIEGVWETLKP